MWFTTLITLLSKVPSTTISLLTGINFNAIGKTLSLLGQNIIKYWYLWTIGLLICINLFTSWEWHRTADALVREKASHQKDIQDFKTAQTIANVKADAIRTALKKESQAHAEQADANYTGLLVKYHASLVRYAHKSSPKQSDNYQLPTTQSSDRSGTSSDLPPTIIITGEDAQVCAVNTARLQAVHDWAINLPK